MKFFEALDHKGKILYRESWRELGHYVICIPDDFDSKEACDPDYQYADSGKPIERPAPEKGSLYLKIPNGNLVPFATSEEEAECDDWMVAPWGNLDGQQTAAQA